LNPGLVPGDWWNIDTEEVIQRAIALGGRYNASDAYTINGQPGPLYNCSSAGESKEIKHLCLFLFFFFNEKIHF
jgi:laccase